ncbi:CHASE2 domain-containing protein [Psychroserpens jangbogonensis]|uniref:CHASE2 domain-containing protein n=1 Tax=Psychroserpens jangbogonensis TaxID=1484460 RepID=UPI00053DDD8C|nr:CHASE2 domain-containing protein [Psychroserpens jangbogonensis]
MKKKTKLLIRDAFLSTILSSILLLILSIAFINIRFFNPLHKAFSDFSFLDIFYSEKFHNTDKVNSDIILVNIENHDREVIANLLNSILKEDPKAVGFDIILENRPEKTKTDTFLAKLLLNKKVVTTFETSNDSLIFSDPFFKTRHRSGFAEFNFKTNTAVIREFIGKKEFNEKSHSSFATLLAQKYLSKKQWEKYNYDERLTKLQTIKYSGNYTAFPYLSLDDFFLNEDKPILKDKIVIMGYIGSPTGNKNDILDKFFTPLNPTSAGKSDSDMFGSVVHGNITNMLIKNDLMNRVSFFWMCVITFICMYLSTILYMKWNKKYKISYRTRKQTYQLVFSVVLFAIVVWFFKNDIVINPFPIVIGVIIAGSYFKYYKHLTRYINTKRKWKTYLK